MQNLLGAFFSHPVFRRPLILVAGTNGKGSVCALLESALRYSGFKTGLYTSPHLVQSHERIRVAKKGLSVPVTSDALEASLKLVETWRDENLPDATFFEIATAAAFVVFEKEDVDVIICEVGLGGRLDSTNAFSPVVSVVTNIGFDHQELLGNTLDAIAREKAFVARRNRPLVCGNLGSEAKRGVAEVVTLIEASCKDSTANLPPEWEAHAREIASAKKPWHSANVDHVRTALCTLQNFECETKLKLDHKKVLEGLLATKWPGRFDVRKTKNATVVFDAGHNADGLRHLLSQLKMSAFSDEKFNLVFGCFADKDWRDMLPMLKQVARSIAFTKIENERAQDPKILQSEFQKICDDPKIKSTAHQNLSEAIEVSLSCDVPTLIVGSIALIGTAMAHLKISPFEPEGAT